MGFHVNVWVTGDLIERDRGAVRANGTTHWSSYHRFRKETKRRKMTIDCLSANNRCETVRVWPIQTTHNPVILRSALSNITLEIMLLLNITGVSEWWPAAATSCVAVSHTGDDIQNKYLSLAHSILSSVTLTFFDFSVLSMKICWQKQQPQRIHT